MKSSLKISNLLEICAILTAGAAHAESNWGSFPGTAENTRLGV